MARGKRNDHIQIDPDSGVNMEGETFDAFEPMERVEDGLQGKNSASNVGKNRDQLHHVDVQYQVREDGTAQRTSQLSNARTDGDLVISQSQFNNLLDQVKN